MWLRITWLLAIVFLLYDQSYENQSKTITLCTVAVLVDLMSLTAYRNKSMITLLFTGLIAQAAMWLCYLVFFIQLLKECRDPSEEPSDFSDKLGLETTLVGTTIML